LGMVFQSYGLWPHFSVADNVSFGLKMRKVSRGDVVAKVQEALRLVRLEGFGDRYPSQLSGGEQQRVAFARALVYKPDVLLLDEPLSNLDAALREEMRLELKELQQQTGITTLYVTHDQVEAMTMGHRIAVLNQGRLQQLGTPMELYRWPSNLFVAQFIGSPPMNVLPVQVGRSQTLHLGDRRVSVEGPLAEALA
ncbi:MAG: ABC transporter ATP-binding protein, partial [Nitrospinota bacterium]|nr:ABC transporter ATP-binding protein [Nitrospinota bacterium]